MGKSFRDGQVSRLLKEQIRTMLIRPDSQTVNELMLMTYNQSFNVPERLYIMKAALRAKDIIDGN